MKKFYFIALAIIFAFAETSCSKYEEGPLISLSSKKARLLGEWKVVEFMKDDEDLTHFYLDTCGCTIQFVFDEVTTQGKTDNYFFINCPNNAWNYGSYYAPSSWDFTSDKNYILLRLGHNNSSKYRKGLYPLTHCPKCLAAFKIMMLSNKKLWLRYDDIQNVYTIKFEKI
jgi:hypothetical protein